MAFQAGLSTYDPNADLGAAIKEQEAAVGKWAESKRAVERKSGYAAAARAQKRCSDHFEGILAELVDLRPINRRPSRQSAGGASQS